MEWHPTPHLPTIGKDLGIITTITQTKDVLICILSNTQNNPVV